MNWDEAKGHWTQVKGSVREQWGKLTDDDLDVIAGRRDQSVGALQKRYGQTKEQVEEQIGHFEHRMKEAASQRMPGGAQRAPSGQSAGQRESYRNTSEAEGGLRLYRSPSLRTVRRQAKTGRAGVRPNRSRTHDT